MPLVLAILLVLGSCKQQEEVTPVLEQETSLNTNEDWQINEAYLKENGISRKAFEEQFKKDMQAFNENLKVQLRNARWSGFDLDQGSFDAFRQSFDGILFNMATQPKDWFAFEVNTSPAQLDFGMKLSQLSSKVRNLPGLRLNNRKKGARMELDIKNFRFHTIQSLGSTRIRVFLSANAELRYYTKKLVWVKLATAKGSSRLRMDISFDVNSGNIILDNTTLEDISIKITAPLLIFVKPLLGTILHLINFKVDSHDTDFSQNVSMPFLTNSRVSLSSISRTNINRCGDYILFKFNINLPSYVSYLLGQLGNRSIGYFPNCNSGGGSGGGGGGGPQPIEDINFR
ncbi:hypothetical protein BKI52_37340 [marine bacterium AO1-C]|nr:hypothetical protein BKI52_37340 [marine bacterium AO1-C]